MKAYYKLVNSDKMLAQMVITMPVKEWKELVDSLKTDYAGNRFSSMVQKLIRKAEESFYEEGETNGYD